MMQSLLRAYIRSFQGLPAQVWWIAFALFVNRSGSMVMAFLSLYVTSQLGLTPAQAGSLLTVYGLGSVVSSYTGGQFVARWGPLPVLTASLLLAGVAHFVLLVPRSFLGMLGGVAFWSLVADAGRPASAGAVTDATSPAEHSRALTLIRLAENLGMTFGPVLGGILAEYNYRWLFVADGLTCLGAGTLLACWSRSFRDKPCPRETVAVRTERSPWRDSQFLTFLGLVFILGLILFQLLGTYPLYLREQCGLRPRTIGFLYAMNTILIVLLEMPLMQACTGRSRLRLLSWGSLIFCLGFGILASGSGFVIALISLVVWTMGEMLSFSPATTFASSRAEGRNRGAYLGMYTMAYSCAFVLAPQLGMRAYQIWPASIWWVALSTAPLLWAAFQWLDRWPSQPAAHRVTLAVSQDLKS